MALTAVKKAVVKRIIGGGEVVVKVPAKRKPVAKAAVAPEPPAPKVTPGEPTFETGLVHGTCTESAGKNDYYGARGLAIADPAILVPKVKWADRTPFLQGLAGIYPFDTTETVVPLSKLPADLQRDPRVKDAWNSYNALSGHSARLPKFTKWLSSVFPDFQQLHQAVAKAMQDNRADAMVFAVDRISLYNAGNSPHYASCLTTARKEGDKVVPYGTFISVLNAIQERAPGIAVAYILDAKTKMMKGRTWVHHVRSEKYGDCLHIAYPYGCLSENTFVKAMLNKHPNMVILGGNTYNGQNRKGWEMVGFPSDLGHYDTYNKIGQGNTILTKHTW